MNNELKLEKLTIKEKFKICENVSENKRYKFKIYNENIIDIYYDDKRDWILDFDSIFWCCKTVGELKGFIYNYCNDEVEDDE